MVPKSVILEAGKYFLKKQGASLGIHEDEITDAGIVSLGLSDVAPFDANKKIIERRFLKNRLLATMPIINFAKELASNSPAPGGGSVAALAGSMSAALSAMVASLTYDKKGFEEMKPEMEKIGIKAHEIMERQLNAIDDDTEAFNAVMECMHMPKSTDEQKRVRTDAIERANKAATMEPFHVLERTPDTIDIATAAAKKGNPNSLSDAGVAGLMAYASAYGAYYNVMINLSSINDKKWCNEIKSKSNDILKQISEKVEKLKAEMADRLKA